MQLRRDPRLLLLDELAAGLNPTETHELTELIAKLRDESCYAILMIEHDMHVVEGISDRVVALDHGVKIAEGSFDEVATNPRGDRGLPRRADPHRRVMPYFSVAQSGPECQNGSSDISGVPNKVLEIGSSLREARRRRGLELSDASAATLIRARYLEALESERFEVLPEGPYLRSFLREYAEFLGLDGDILVTELMLRLVPPPPVPPETPASGGVAAFLSELPPRSMLVFLTLVLAAVAVWQLGGSSPTTVRTSQSGAIPSRQASGPSVRAKPLTFSAKHQAPSSLLLAAARGPCWLLARIGSRAGPIIEEHTLQQGQTVRFGLKRPLWIRVGAPWNLDASIGGRSLTASLPTHTGNVLVTAAGIGPT